MVPERVQTQVCRAVPGTALDRLTSGEITACATKCSLVSEQAGRLSRFPSQAGTGHFTREHLSVHLCPVGAYEGLLLETLPASGVETRVARSQGRQPGILHRSAQTTRRTAPPMTDRLLAIGRADLMLYGQAVLTLHERHSRSCRTCQARRRSASPAPSPTQCGGRSPSTTGPSSHAIIGSMTWAYRPSSAILVPLGRRAVSRTPTAACATLPRKIDLAPCRKSVYTADSGPQQYTAQVPGLQNPGRDNSGPCVALEM